MDISVGGGNHNARERIRKRSLRIVGTLITTYRVRAPNTITDLELSCRDQPRSHRLLHKSPLIDLSDTLLAPFPTLFSFSVRADHTATCYRTVCAGLAGENAPSSIEEGRKLV